MIAEATGVDGSNDVVAFARETGALTPVVATRFAESGSLAPDGRWLAYATDESGRTELYLRAWAGDLTRYPFGEIQNVGGSASRVGGRRAFWWVSGGRQLVFRGRDGFMVVTVGERPGVAKPAGWVEIPGVFHSTVAPDGRRRLVIMGGTSLAARHVNLVQDWTRTLAR